MREAELIESEKAEWIDGNHANQIYDDETDDESTGCGDDVDTLMESDHADDDVVMVQERRQP